MTRATLTLAMLVLPAALVLGADPKKVEPAFAQSDEIDLTASAIIDRAEIDRLLGVPLDKGIYLVHVKVRPKGEKPVKIVLDDFIILKQDDGQRSTPFAPTQIASSSGLTLQSQRLSGWGAQGNGPVWGGIGGGRPRTMPGNGGTVGSATSGADVVQATEKDGKETPASNALLEALRSKGLAEKETNETVEGLLYFPLDGKVKLKDLLLIYKAPGGKMELRFLRK